MGITTGIAALGDALGIGDILSGLGSALGFGEAAAAPAAGIGEAAATSGIAAAAPAAGATDLGAIVGTGQGLFGGTTGLEGTLLAAGAPSISAGGLATGAGLGAAGTAADFLAAPTATGGVSTAGGFGATADTAAAQAAATGTASGLGGIPGADIMTGLSPSLSAPTATGAPVGGAAGSVTPAPSITPAAAGPAAAPAGAAPTDLTSITGTGTGLPGGSTGVTGTNLATGGSQLASTPNAVASGINPEAAAASGTGNVLDQMVSNAGKSIVNNPLSLVAPAAGLGGLAYNVLQSKKQLPEQTALDQAALTATNTGNQLSSYLTSGTLPAGLQTAVDKATQDAKTAAISNAAKNGQPTDPSQNTALAAQLASIDQQATITTATVGQQLLSSGLSETQLASQDFSTLLNADMTQQNNIATAIGNFAKSLGSLGSSGIKLNIGNTGATVSS
jgi:hypothetical protein